MNMYKNLIDPDILIKFPSTKPESNQLVNFKKLVININYNTAITDYTLLYKLLEYLYNTSINYSPKILKAKTSISNFKRRKGVPIGFLLTLRKTNILNFYIYFINFLLPYLVRTYDNKYKLFKSINNYNSFNIGISSILGSSYSMSINFIINNNNSDFKNIYYFSFFSFPIFDIPSCSVNILVVSRLMIYR